MSTNITDRIRKLLALAEGTSNPHEAENAAAQAQRLIAKHNIERSELTEYDPDEAVRQEIMHGGKLVAWRVNLISGLAKLNSCASAVRRAQRGGSPCAYVLYGAPSDIALVEHLAAYLIREIQSLGASYRGAHGAPTRAHRNVYRVGVVAGVLERMRSEQESAMTGQASALMYVGKRSDAARALMREKIGNRRHRMGRMSGTQNDYDAGVRAGRKVRVRRAIGS